MIRTSKQGWQQKSKPNVYLFVVLKSKSPVQDLRCKNTGFFIFND